MSLKKDFPHLFNQSYNSDDPELVTVTPFCETGIGESTSRPGLEFQFSPPGHRKSLACTSSAFIVDVSTQELEK